MIKRSPGFTIVELLVVIVVIGILATITTVAYSGVQARAKDSRLMEGANQFADAIDIWATKNGGQLPKGGWGSTAAVANGNCSDGVSGWVASGMYTCTIEDVLADAQLLPAGYVSKLPPNEAFGGGTSGVRSLMLYTCSGTNRYILYWFLNSPTDKDTTNLDALVASGCPPGPRDNYGMKAAKIIQL